MTKVNVHEAKTQLSRLLERAHGGEEIVIARSGKPVARLVPYRQDPPKRVFGRLRGQIMIHGDLDADDEEIAREFEASQIFPDDR